MEDSIPVLASQHLNETGCPDTHPGPEFSVAKAGRELSKFSGAQTEVKVTAPTMVVPS